MSFSFLTFQILEQGIITITFPISCLVSQKEGDQQEARVALISIEHCHRLIITFIKQYPYYPHFQIFTFYPKLQWSGTINYPKILKNSVESRGLLYLLHVLEGIEIRRPRGGLKRRN